MSRESQVSHFLSQTSRNPDCLVLGAASIADVSRPRARSEVRMDRLLDKAMEKVEEVEGAKYDVSLNGSLVHVVGELEPNPQERLADPVFKVTWLIGECSIARASRKKTT